MTTVYDFEDLPARFQSDEDGGLIDNPVVGSMLPIQRWDIHSPNDAYYPINLDFGNGWVTSVFVDGGNNNPTFPARTRNAKIIFQTAQFNQTTGSFEQPKIFTSTDLDMYQVTTPENGTTDMYAWQPFSNMLSQRNMKTSGHRVANGRCVFVMPSDDRNLSGRRADHLWLFVVDCSSSGDISFTRHLVYSATESISGVPGTETKNNFNSWGVQAVENRVIVYWSFGGGIQSENESWLVSRVVNLDTLALSDVNIVLNDPTPIGGFSPYKFAYSHEVQGHVVVQCMFEGAWAQPSGGVLIVVMDGVTGEFVSLTDLSPVATSYGETSFTFASSGTGLAKLNENRLTSIVHVRNAHTTGTIGVVVIDLAFNNGVVSLTGGEAFINHPTEDMTWDNGWAGIGIEVLPDNRVGVFAWNGSDIWTEEETIWDYPTITFFIVDVSTPESPTWKLDGVFPASWESDMAGSLEWGPVFGIHIGGWWAYLGRNRGPASLIEHGWELGYYSIRFGDIQPDLPTTISVFSDNNKLFSFDDKNRKEAVPLVISSNKEWYIIAQNDSTSDIQLNIDIKVAAAEVEEDQ